MARLSEIPAKAQIVLLLVIVAGLSVGLYFVLYKTMADQVAMETKKLAARQADIRSLRPYESKLADMERQSEQLKQQLEIQRRIVPDDKEADQFLHMIQNTATAAGIEVRRYSSKPITTHEFYTEAGFDLELDGSYYSMLKFFDRVAKLERIINVTNLQVGAIKNGGVKLKKAYIYAPGESVLATCTASTFYSNPDAVGGPPIKGAPAKGKKKGK